MEERDTIIEPYLLTDNIACCLQINVEPMSVYAEVYSVNGLFGVTSVHCDVK